MGIFDKTPEQRREEAKRLQEKSRRDTLAAFNETPQGRARSARRQGRKYFQFELRLSHTEGVSNFLFTASTATGRVSAAETIESVESEGWDLRDVGYVYRVTGSIGGEKILSTREAEAFHGDIIGIYLFKATDGDPPSPLKEAPSYFENGSKE